MMGAMSPVVVNHTRCLAGGGGRKVEVVSGGIAHVR
jgi:hypothetical protein